MKEANEKADVVQSIIGFNLADRRERLGVTAEQVFERLEIDEATLQAFEEGRSRPDAKALLALARLLDVPPHYFFSIPKDLDAARRALLSAAGGEAGDGDPAGNGGGPVMRAFARMKNRAGRHVVADMAQAISNLNSEI